MSRRGKSAAAENDLYGRRILGWIALGRKLLRIRVSCCRLRSTVFEAIGLEGLTNERREAEFNSPARSSGGFHDLADAPVNRLRNAFVSMSKQSAKR